MDIKVKISPKEWAEKRMLFMLTDYVQENGRLTEHIDNDLKQCGFVLDEEAEEPKPICTNHSLDTDGFCWICGETVYDLLNESKDLEPEPTPQRSEKWLACEKYLKMLPDGYRERALSQMDEEFLVKSELVFCIKDAVLWFCNWDNTKEGWDFWNDVGDHYIFGKPLPQLPND